METLNDSSDELLFLDESSGSLGMGTTTPSGKLQITGNEVRIGDGGSISYATGDGDLYIEDQLEIDGTTYPNNIIFGNSNVSVQRGTLLAMSQSSGSWNVLGFSENRFTRADEKYTVTISPGCDSGSSTSIFDNEGDSSCLYSSWVDGVSTSVVTIDLVGTGSPLHYYANLSINMPYSRRVSGVKVEKYYDIDSGDGWSCNEGDNTWSTIYEDTSNTRNDIYVKSGLGNGICRFRITFSGTAATAGYLSIGEISAQQYFYGPDGGGYVATTGDTIYGNLTLGTSTTNRNLTVTGDVAVNGGDITTTATTFNLLNTTATTLNLGGAATTLTLGSTSGTATIRNATTAVTGNLDVNGSTNDIAGTLNLSGGALTSTGALSITPQAGNNLNIALSTTGDFTVNTNDLYVDTSTGRVGIGTTSPTRILHVSGDGIFTGNLTMDTGAQIFNDSGSASEPGYAFRNDQNYKRRLSRHWDDESCNYS